MEKNEIVIRDPKTFCFNFDLPKDVDENLKREIELIIKSNKSLAENKIKKYIAKYKLDGYKLELQTPETTKLFGSTKDVEKVPSPEIVEVVLVQCYFVENQHQRKSVVSCTFTPNKSYADFLNVGPSNLVFLKTYNTEFDKIIITFTD